MSRRLRRPTFFAAPFTDLRTNLYDPSCRACTASENGQLQFGVRPETFLMSNDTVALVGSSRAQDRLALKHALMGLAGTSIEWYDFLLYGTAAALVFPTVFFPATLSPFFALA